METLMKLVDLYLDWYDVVVMPLLIVAFILVIVLMDHADARRQEKLSAAGRGAQKANPTIDRPYNSGQRRAST